MVNYNQVRKIFQKIQIVRAPKHRLATFGPSSIEYKLVTNVPGLSDRSRLREGRVAAEKPAIITPQALRERFLGFSSEANEYADWFVSNYGEALRGLEYQFRNESLSSRIELTPPDVLMKELIKEFDQKELYRSVLILGSEKLWELSIMKFIVEETLSSFPSNFQELQERGFFDTDDRLYQQRTREIRVLFKKAKVNSTLVPMLGKKLKDYGLFEKYQDEFFHLVNK